MDPQALLAAADQALPTPDQEIHRIEQLLGIRYSQALRTGDTQFSFDTLYSEEDEGYDSFNTVYQYFEDKYSPYWDFGGYEGWCITLSVPRTPKAPTPPGVFDPQILRIQSEALLEQEKIRVLGYLGEEFQIALLERNPFVRVPPSKHPRGYDWLLDAVGDKWEFSHSGGDSTLVPKKPQPVAVAATTEEILAFRAWKEAKAKAAKDQTRDLMDEEPPAPVAKNRIHTSDRSDQLKRLAEPIFGEYKKMRETD